MNNLANMKNCSEVQGNLILDVSLLGMGQKAKTFLLKAVMLHIKLKGTEYRASSSSVLTHTLNPQDWVNGPQHFFSESTYSVLTHKHTGPLGWNQKVKSLFSGVVM